MIIPGHFARARGFTLPELLVAAAIGSTLLAATATLSLFGARSLTAIANYVDLDSKDRNTLDYASREIRNATDVLSFQTNAGVISLAVTNATSNTLVTLSYDPTAKCVTLQKTGQSTKTNLTQCNSFTFQFFTRVPTLSSTNITFSPATNSAGQLDPTAVKLVELSWTAARPLSGSRSESESMQMARIVLRNKM